MALLADHIYPHLPDWAQDLAISLYGLTYRHERLGGCFDEYVRDFQSRDRCSPAEMNAYVEERLRRVLTYAFDQVPYYREKWAEAGLGRADLARITVAGLPQLPVLPKHDLRDTPEAFVAEDAAKGSRLCRYFTSGSTGTPITAICTPDGHRRFLAARDVRSFGWAGASVRDPRAMIGGRMVVPRSHANGRLYRYNFAERQVYFSAYHISASTAAGYVAGFNRYQPRVFTGYAYSHYFLAHAMLSQGLKLHYSPQCLVLGSEKTTSEMKQTIRAAFGARAYEEYGSVENCALATECEAGSLHVSPDFGIVEIVDERGLPVPPGREGRILCTGLLNDAQPLVRYDIGDTACWSSTPCSCGRDHLPVLKEIQGRLEDAVVGPDGREMVRFHGLFINLPHVVEGQVIQESLSALRVRVVAGERFSAEEALAIEQRVRARLGGVQVKVEQVPYIERTPRGKFRAVISHLERQTVHNPVSIPGPTERQ